MPNKWKCMSFKKCKKTKKKTLVSFTKKKVSPAKAAEMGQIWRRDGAPSPRPAPEPAPAPQTARPTPRPTPAPPPDNKAGCASLYGQCGGENFSGAKCCKIGSCYKEHRWYSQCLKSCPSGWDCAR